MGKAALTANFASCKEGSKRIEYPRYDHSAACSWNLLGCDDLAEITQLRRDYLPSACNRPGGTDVHWHWAPSLSPRQLLHSVWVASIGFARGHSLHDVYSDSKTLASEKLLGQTLHGLGSTRVPAMADVYMRAYTQSRNGDPELCQ